MREKEKPQLLYQKLGHTMVNLVNDDTAGRCLSIGDKWVRRVSIGADAPTQQTAKCAIFFSVTEKKYIPSYLFYTCDLPPIFSFSHSTVSRIVLLSGLGV